ncbi:LexA family protein [Paenibacillus sp. CN-4]|uniref:LexA family protein n=1 Tax=Paenibacillus nanchangensis TaxID=3348343 RepID=UPI0039790B4E
MKLYRHKGYSPTVREVMTELGLSSSSTAKGLIDQLDKKGYIKRKVRSARSLQVIRNAE